MGELSHAMSGFTMLFMIISCNWHFTRPDFHRSSFNELDGSAGFKCTSKNFISADWVCDGRFDCEDQSDEMYCVDESCRFEGSGTYTDGEDICRREDNKCSCVPVAISLVEDGENIYEIVKPRPEKNFPIWLRMLGYLVATLTSCFQTYLVNRNVDRRELQADLQTPRNSTDQNNE